MPKKTTNEYQPDEVSPPGETLLEVLEAQGLNQTALAQRTGRPKKTINEIIKGKAAITADTALQLERVLGVPAAFWNARQRDFEQSQARAAERSRLEGQVEWVDQFPVAEMAKLGWIERHSDRVEQVQELLTYFGVASPDQWTEVWLSPEAAFRNSPAFESNRAAVAAWLRRGEIEGRGVICSPFDPEAFRGSLARFRELTREPVEIGIKTLTQMCALAGVAVVFVKSVPGVRASGATRWLSPDRALMQLSLRYKRADQLWFTVFHEAAHILLHGKKQVFIEDDEKDEAKEEHEANIFAQDQLLPRAVYASFVAATNFSRARILEFSEQQRVHPGIVVGRLQREKHIPWNHHTDLFVKLRWAAE